MKFTLPLSAVFRNVVYTYDAISPALIAAGFEVIADGPLIRAHIPTGQKEEITLDMLISFNQTGTPALQLSYFERHSLLYPLLPVKSMLNTDKYPSPTDLEEQISQLVDYKNTSAGHISNALTYYLCAKALQYVGLQTGEGAGRVDLSPLEIALNIRQPAL